MKFPLFVLFLGLATLAQSKETSAPPAGIPKDAVAVEGHTWRWVDKDGKAWLYRSTPFGLMRSEEPKETAAKPSGLMKADEPKGGVAPATPETGGMDAALALITVKEEGDSLRFSRPGPFGAYSWVKKKTQLDRDETIVWTHARAKAGARKD
ncbi:MAG: hypothetical protein HYX27_16530 [Acidobacteria bacterium]|nr:hypothetical protein [Acidobacteriota bacterium]